MRRDPASILKQKETLRNKRKARHLQCQAEQAGVVPLITPCAIPLLPKQVAFMEEFQAFTLETFGHDIRRGEIIRYALDLLATDFRSAEGRKTLEIWARLLKAHDMIEPGYAMPMPQYLRGKVPQPAIPQTATVERQL
jgi:hypothetical protein